MEKKQKSSIVSFMMVVGVVFILTAGCICVKQAWQYLPDAVKQVCLLGVAIGSLAGSVFAGKNEILKKTETALFYIGDIFLGYFFFAVTSENGIMSMCEMEMAKRLLWCTLIMIVPVLVKFVCTRQVSELTIFSVMMNAGIVFFMSCVEADFDVYVLSISFVGCILLAGLYLMKESGEFDEKVMICSKVIFMVQEIFAAICLAGSCFGNAIFIREILVTENASFLLLILCVVLSGIIWYDEKEIGNNLQVVVLGFEFAVMLLYNMSCGVITDALVLGLAALVVLILAGANNRKAFVVLSAITLLLIAFYITREFWLSIAWWVYMFVAGVVLVLVAIKKEREGE